MNIKIMYTFLIKDQGISSVETLPEIRLVRVAAAFLVPGLVALFDQGDCGIAIGTRHCPPDGNFLLSQEPVMTDFDGIDPAVFTKKIRFNVFVAHNTAGDGGNIISLFKFSLALRTLDHTAPEKRSFLLTSRENYHGTLSTS
jgi:hypothetical protein